MQRRLPSVREVAFTSDRGGWVTTGRFPLLSNGFTVYNTGEVVFDRPGHVGQTARVELVGMLRARGVRNAWVWAVGE